MSMRRTPGRAALLAGAVLLLAAAPAAGQSNRFVGIGGGAGIPVGAPGEMMDIGWVAELMGGFVLPNNIMSVRLGVMHSSSRVPGMDAMEYIPPGTSRLYGAMAGVMMMPDWDWDWVPYVHAGAGALHSRFQGSTTSFAWATGAGATLKWRTIDFFVEGRLLQARRAGGRGEMVTLTTGIRLLP
jgi:hypothetical protein